MTRQPARDLHTCLEPEQVQVLLAGTPSEQQREDIERRLDECELCRALVSESARHIATRRSSPRRPNRITRPIDNSGGLNAYERSRHLQTGAVVGRYTVLRRVGEGGMGVVYLAEDPELHRQVVIKLLHPRLGKASDTRSNRSRLKREAQAMAQVSHTNVVAVFDVGNVGDEVFVAMEYVEGRHLGTWLAERPDRPWRETLDVLVRAGRGLAAAHDAGLVHRDFKPQNVLVSSADQVKVTDFGLAHSGIEQSPTAALSSGSLTPSSSPLGLALTITGAMIGTPAYMSPEQLSGATTDHRSDQFSFCVTLYEALFGSRPFPGNSAAEVFAAVTAGAIERPAQTNDVPPAIFSALARGLLREPDNRFESMDALLTQLIAGRSKARPLRTALVVAAASVAIAVVAVSASAGFSQQAIVASECDSVEKEFEQAWNDSRRQTVRDRFEAASTPASSAQFVISYLDTYADEWVAMRRETCRAKVAAKSQSPADFKTRAACLGRVRNLADEFATQLTEADGVTARAAVRGVLQLSAAKQCAEARFHPELGAMPSDPRKREDIASAWKDIDKALAHFYLDRYDDAKRLSTRALEQSRDLGFDPLRAEALAMTGTIGLLQGSHPEAKARLEEAVALAERAEHVTASALASIMLSVLGRIAGDADAAQSWKERAEQALPRLIDDPHDEAAIAGALVTLYLMEGDVTKAIVTTKRIRDIMESLFGGGHLRTALAIRDVAEVYAPHSQRYAAAIPHYERALAILRELPGSEHPETAATVARLAFVRFKAEDADSAISLAREAIASAKRFYSQTDETLYWAYSALAGGLALADRNDEALAAAQEFAKIHESAVSSNEFFLAEAWLLLAQLYIRVGRTQESVDVLEGLVTMREKSAGRLNAAWLTPAQELAVAHHENGDTDRAVAFFDEILETAAQVYPKESAAYVDVLTRYGETLASADRAKDAVKMMKIARKARTGPGHSETQRASTSFVAARVMWDSGGSKARARDLAAAAIDLFTEVGADASADQVREWIAKRSSK